MGSEALLEEQLSWTLGFLREGHGNRVPGFFPSRDPPPSPEQGGSLQL